MLRLEARPAPSRFFAWASPVLSLLITIAVATLLFTLLGKDPVRSLTVFLIEPFNGLRSITELGLKATPLILCSLGLALCFRSNVWNIGAEGQYIIGALCAAGVGIAAGTTGGPIVVFLMVVAGNETTTKLLTETMRLLDPIADALAADLALPEDVISSLPEVLEKEATWM